MVNSTTRDPFERAARGFGWFGHASYRRFHGRRARRAAAGWSRGTLALDVVEKGGDLIVRASLPGFSNDEIKVHLDGRVLSISATRAEQEQSEDERHYRRERRTGSLSRRIALPAAVAGAEVDAELKDGVLTLTIAIPEAARSKQIEVRSSD